MIQPSDVERAKERVVVAYERTISTQRRWLIAHLDSYDSFSNRLTLYALEGSPCKGWVVVNHALDLIQAFDCRGKPIKLQTTIGGKNYE